MCKVFVAAGINDTNRDKMMALVREMAKEMSTGNRDGCGYAAIDMEGKLFGERWLENSQAFTNVNEALQFGDAVEGIGEYNKFGDVSLGKMAAITLHTRMATSAKGMANTHPFVYEEDDTSLIHNGIIDNDKDFKLKVSTCDSEALLQAYLQNEVNKSPPMVSEMAKMVYGYYAAGVFSRDADGNRILDVFKGGYASLIVAYIYELDTYVFTTSEPDLTSACRKLNLTPGKAYTVKEGHLLRFDPFTSKVIVRDQFVVSPRTKPFVSSYTGGNHYNRYDEYEGVSDRGDSHSTHTRAITNYKGDTTKDDVGRSANIIDVSIAGARERNAKSKASEEILAMKSCIPSIRECTINEVRELGLAAGWWSKEV